jgi:hypothetical protein
MNSEIYILMNGILHEFQRDRLGRSKGGRDSRAREREMKRNTKLGRISRALIPFSSSRKTAVIVAYETPKLFLVTFANWKEFSLSFTRIVRKFELFFCISVACCVYSNRFF